MIEALLGGLPADKLVELAAEAESWKRPRGLNGFFWRARSDSNGELPGEDEFSGAVRGVAGRDF